MAGTDLYGLKNAKWIGSPKTGYNTWNVTDYEWKGNLTWKEKETSSVVFGARDHDNYLEVSFLRGENAKLMVCFLEHSDLVWKGKYEEQIHYAKRNAWERVNSHWKKCLGKFASTILLCDELSEITYEIVVHGANISIRVNGEQICCKEPIMPEALATEPRKSRQMLTGFCSKDSFELQDEVPTVTVGKWITIPHGRKLKKAVYYSTARGFYESYLDGEKVGDEFYAPGFTDYRIHIDYQEYDVTQMIRKKCNENLDSDVKLFLSAIVTRGYYAGFCGYSGAENYGRENSYLAALCLSYVDGEEWVVTDESWLFTSKSPVIAGDYLDGEFFDARNQEVLYGKRREEWEACGVKEAPGKPVPSNGSFRKEAQPDFLLLKQTYSGAKIREILPDLSVIEPVKGHFVYDFGQNLVGSVRIEFLSKRGCRYRIRYGEMSYKNGEIYIQNTRTAANNDIYICKGEDDVYIPSFTSHGFRYVEITGDGWCMENPDSIKRLEGLVIHNLERQTGDFVCSDELLNRLQKNISWGQKGNYLLVPTDCPQRNERMGWTGDAQVFAATAAFNMDVKKFTRKWLQDLREATIMYNRDGAIPDTAPLGGDNRPGPCGGWSDAAVIVPWELYKEYGDVSILEENYEMMKGWVAYQMRPDRESQEGIQLEVRRGDHLAYDTSTPFELCATAYAARCADLMARSAHALLRKEDAAFYAERFAILRRSFMKKWINEEGTLLENSQTSYALSIDFGLLPGTLTKEQMDLQNVYHPFSEEEVKASLPEKIVDGFVQAIKERDNHLSVGFLGISHLLPALTKIGKEELAAEILMVKTEPGWLYSVLNGATTIWERWNSYIAETGTFGDVNMNSFNHYAYGSVGAWMYENILGIVAVEPGYRKVRIEPKALCGLTFAKGYHDTIYGRIEVAWEIKNGKMEVTITKPEEIELVSN